MMVGGGAALMSRSGGNDEAGKLAMEVKGKNGKKGSDRSFEEGQIDVEKGRRFWGRKKKRGAWKIASC
jgi:hypothetical protein